MCVCVCVCVLGGFKEGVDVLDDVGVVEGLKEADFFEAFVTGAEVHAVEADFF